MNRRILYVVALLLLSNDAIADEIRAEGKNYQARSFFTSGLRNNSPVDKIDRADLDMDRVILFTVWSELEDKLYHKEVRLFDPNGALSWTWFYEFTPCDSGYNTWFWWQLDEYRDTPGYWRFEVYLDDEKAFENTIEIASESE